MGFVRCPRWAHQALGPRWPSVQRWPKRHRRPAWRVSSGPENPPAPIGFHLHRSTCSVLEVSGARLSQQPRHLQTFNGGPDGHKQPDTKHLHSLSQKYPLCCKLMRWLIFLSLAAALNLPAWSSPTEESPTVGLSERGLVSQISTQLSAVKDKASDQAVGMVEQAMGLLGVPYRRGGNSESTGFDCSGFVRHLYEKSVGQILPRRAVDQARATEKSSSPAIWCFSIPCVGPSAMWAFTWAMANSSTPREQAKRSTSRTCAALIGKNVSMVLAACP